ASFRCNSFLHSAFLHSALFIVVVYHGVVRVHHIGAAVVSTGLAAHVGAAGLLAILLVELLADGVEGLGELLGGALDGLGVVALQGLLQLAQGGLYIAAVSGIDLAAP